MLSLGTLVFGHLLSMAKQPQIEDATGGREVELLLSHPPFLPWSWQVETIIAQLQLDMLDELKYWGPHLILRLKKDLHSDSLGHMEFPISAGSIFSSTIEAFGIASQSPFGWMNSKKHMKSLRSLAECLRSSCKNAGLCLESQAVGLSRMTKVLCMSEAIDAHASGQWSFQSGKTLFMIF